MLSLPPTCFPHNMKRGSLSHNLGSTSPSLVQKGWSLERVPLPISSGQRHSNGTSSLMGVSPRGRTLPSKWEDAERWICSPVLGYGEGNQSLHSHGQTQRRPKSKSGPIVAPGDVYYSNCPPANVVFDGGSVKNFGVGSPFSTGVLGVESVSLLYGGGGGMGRSTSGPELAEFQNEKLESRECEEESAISRAVSQRDMGTQISSKGCLHSPPKRRSSFAPSSSSLVSIVEQQRDHFSKLEVREVQVDNGASVTKESTRHGSATNGPPEVYDFDQNALENQASSFNIEEEDMNISRRQREEAKITAWENLQKAKAEAALRKLEMKLEKKRSSTMDKIMKELRKAQIKAHKKRSSIPGNDGHCLSSGKHVRLGFLGGCFTCNAS